MPAALPKQCLSHLAIVIVLDWMHPQSMIEELLRWLSWIEEEFTGKMMEMVGEKEGRKEEVEGRDRREHNSRRLIGKEKTSQLMLRLAVETFIRRYIEPKVDGSSDAVAGLALSNGQTADDDLVALPEGVLTHNRCGLPIVIACTKADRIDATGDALISKGLVAGKGYISSSTGADGPKSWTWDERVDWVQQTLRTVAMKCEPQTKLQTCSWVQLTDGDPGRRRGTMLYLNVTRRIVRESAIVSVASALRGRSASTQSIITGRRPNVCIDDHVNTLPLHTKSQRPRPGDSACTHRLGFARQDQGRPGWL